jgi:nitroreductase
LSTGVAVEPRTDSWIPSFALPVTCAPAFAPPVSIGPRGTRDSSPRAESRREFSIARAADADCGGWSDFGAEKGLSQVLQAAAPLARKPDKSGLYCRGAKSRHNASETDEMPAEMIPYRLAPRETPWQLQRGAELLDLMRQRRSCRHFSDRPVPRSVIEHAMAVAHTAPSGANRKPWRFVAIDDPAIKREIRLATEEEERTNYSERFPAEWLDALEPIGTGPEKPYLEIAPWLVVLFRVDYEILNGEKQKNYYPVESIGIMSGFFLMACHMLGLATLTHTPSPMKFLRDICQRPESEKPILLIPVGYPAADAVVPNLVKKPLEAAMQWNR